VTTREAVRSIAAELQEAGCASPRVDAEWLVAHVVGGTRTDLYAWDRTLDDAEAVRLKSLVERRRTREPLAYVLGEWGFRRLTLKTDARALVPRPETEGVVDRALALLAGVDAPHVLDVGTGTGAIALALKQERPDATVLATDNSPDAVVLARENAAALGLEVETRVSDLLEGIEGRFDLVVSNPPYVQPDEELQPELRYEPSEALFSRSTRSGRRTSQRR
jgi:release factor glutamine methyltransferase